MILERTVDEYLINKGMYKPDKWISIPIGRYWIPVSPAWGFKDWIFLHDAHRLVNTTARAWPERQNYLHGKLEVVDLVDVGGFGLDSLT